MLKLATDADVGVVDGFFILDWIVGMAVIICEC